jgi:integrase/recombinase XerD
LEPLVGIQRAHVELYIRQLGESGLMDSSVNTMMHAVRGFFRFAHIDRIIPADPADPAVYARLPKVHRDESRTQGLDRLELIRFLQVAQTLTVDHGALAYLLGINALRASEAAAVRIEDYADTLRGHCVLHLLGKGHKPATMPLTVAYQPALAAARRDNQCAGCRRPAARCADPGPPRRPQDHRTLRPRPRQPRPSRRPLPHRLRRRRLRVPCPHLRARSGCVSSAHYDAEPQPGGVSRPNGIPETGRSRPIHDRTAARPIRPPL